MMLSEYIDAIKASTSKAEIESLARRAANDEGVGMFDHFFIGAAVGERFNTPVCEL